MNIILLSGGSGKRLWPLSNDVRSKQFLKVIRQSNGVQESMVQRVYRQIKNACLNADISIATSKSQVESLKNQLGNNISIVVEPERRNTFPAIALSAANLFFEKNYPPDETIVILPVDPYVDEEYFHTIQKLNKAVENNVADIVLMGVKPTYPSEKYGYIIPVETDKEESFVCEFKEKPDAKTAQRFIEMGGLWNCGVFAFKLSYIMDILHSKIEFSCYADVLEQYDKLEKTSFDYAVVEMADSVAVVSYNGKWKDLGTWNTLTEVMETQAIGDVILADDCNNTHVINEMDIPIVVMGAKDMIIAASPDGIFISDKEQSSYIKKYVDNINRRPMYEEREWGDYKVLDMTTNNRGVCSVTKRKFIKAGAMIPLDSHNDHSETWVVVKGRCIININGRNHDAFIGDSFSIPLYTEHSLNAIEDTEIIEVQINQRDAF